MQMESSLPLTAALAEVLIQLLRKTFMKLGSRRSASFTALNSEVKELQTSLTATKQKVAVSSNCLHYPYPVADTTKVVTSTFGYRSDPLRIVRAFIRH